MQSLESPLEDHRIMVDRVEGLLRADQDSSKESDHSMSDLENFRRI